MGNWSAYWKTIEDCFNDIHAFDAGYERANGYSKWISISLEHWQSMKPSLQKDQHHAWNVVDHTFRTDTWKTKVILIISSKIIGNQQFS